MASDDRTEPRFIVIISMFLLYGVFLIIVLLYSGTTFWKDFWKLLSNYVRHRLGLRVDDAGGENAVRSNIFDEGMPYELLSERSKKRLDNLRQLAIKRLLSNYSMTLKNEDVVKRQQINNKLEINSIETTSTDNNDLTVSAMINDERSLSDTQSSSSDLETGLCHSKDQCDDLEDSTNERECVDCIAIEEIVGEASYNDESSFTHVLIPHPGVGLFEGERSITCKQAAARKEEPEKEGNSNNDIVTSPENDKTTKRINEQSRRKVPIFCSICLSEFELNEKVCWSSNTECTHVFHSDCMTHWLVALGRRCSTKKRFTVHPTEKQLLGSDEVQCPCCRQEFIKR